MVEIILSAALICFDGACEPALIGRRTPVGEFTLSLMATDEPQYGGDVLAFMIVGRDAYAIHRPPTRHRRAMLESVIRAPVTAGCVNVEDLVYERLRDCCIGSRVVIRE